MDKITEMEFMNSLFAKTIQKPLYGYQRKLIGNPSPKVIINKSRQIGISTLYACYGLVKSCIFGKTVLIVSPSERQSKHVMDYIRNFIIPLKAHFGDLGFQEETKTSIIFKNGGQIVSLPNSPDTVRGFKADLIILDEFAHFLNGTDKEMINAILPSISRGGKITIISTPFGENGLFYEYWTKEKGFEKFVINWKDCPDLKIEEIRESMDEISFSQEYENIFIGELDSYFPFDLIKSCVNEELECVSL